MQLAAAPHVAGVLVELEVGVAQPVLARPGARRPAQHGLHPLDQLLDAERLGDVVVAAEPQALDLVLGGVAGGEEDDRDPGAGALVLAQAAGHLEAVEVGEHHVEHDQVGPAALDRVERGRARSPPARPRSRCSRGPWPRSSVMCSSSSTEHQRLLAWRRRTRLLLVRYLGRHVGGRHRQIEPVPSELPATTLSPEAPATR